MGAQLISHYFAKLKAPSDAIVGYAWLIAQLIDDHQLEEAKQFRDLIGKYDDSYFGAVHRIKITLAERELESPRNRFIRDAGWVIRTGLKWNG